MQSSDLSTGQLSVSQGIDRYSGRLPLVGQLWVPYSRMPSLHSVQTGAENQCEAPAGPVFHNSGERLLSANEVSLNPGPT